MADDLKPGTYKCLDCQTTGNLMDFSGTNECCKNCGKRNLEIKFGGEEFGPLANLHFTTKTCSKCGKIKDIKIHHLPPALGMSEKEFIKKAKEEDKGEQWCNSLTHKPWFWGATLGTVGALTAIGLAVYFWWKNKKKKSENDDKYI